MRIPSNALVILASAFIASTASAQMRLLEVEIRPTADPQIAMWLEDANGKFIDTLMVTRLVGTFGLGNRPGRRDFGGAYLWPYGRREMALPVWAHKRGVLYDRLVFQDCHDSALGWHERYSSAEPFYCRPMTPAEMSVDTISCPTINFSTDKGIPLRLQKASNGPDCAAMLRDLSPMTYYPPRNDITSRDTSRDWEGVREYAGLNTLDAVSRATPRSGQSYRVNFRVPYSVPDGDYVVMVEVNLENDDNNHHNYPMFTDPALPDYGMSTIGQPSVVWRLPVKIGQVSSAAQVRDYAGYGAPDGQDGNVRPPDGTITTDKVGSGAGRLLALSNNQGEYRVRATYTYVPGQNCAPAEPVTDLKLVASTFEGLNLTFVAPTGTGTVTHFEVRYARGSGTIQTDADFDAANPGPTIEAGQRGQTHAFTIGQLYPETAYTVAVRAFEACQGPSQLVAISVVTPERKFATVDACFIATAAYGSKDQADVKALRRFRDRALMTSELGRRFVATYYFFSPAVAASIRDSERLKAVTRFALRPVVAAAKALE